jgi:hypothetical protein
MSWLNRVLGREKKNAADDPNLHCTFCGKHRREVVKLVAGPGVCICDECIYLCNQILDDEGLQHEQRSHYGRAILAQIQQLGRRAPYARVRPLLRALIELERDRPDGLRQAVTAACGVDDLETAVIATRAIPVADRTATDVLNLAAFLTELGSHVEALAALGTLEVEKLAGVDQLLHALHEAHATISRGGLAPREIAALRGRITELGAACEALPAGAFEDGVRGERLAVMTMAALAAGSIDGAENAARARVALLPESATAYEHLARVLAARGDDAGARAARATGLGKAHPESTFAKQLMAKPVDGPFR